MGEISGFGGDYEAACRAMALAGMNWMDAHPMADPQYTGFTSVYGILMKDNEDANTLSKTVVDAANDLGGCTGAMHQAVIGHVLAYKRLGWVMYCRELRERESKEKKDASGNGS